MFNNNGKKFVSFANVSNMVVAKDDANLPSFINKLNNTYRKWKCIRKGP